VINCKNHKRQKITKKIIAPTSVMRPVKGKNTLN